LPKVTKASTVVPGVCHCGWSFQGKDIANVDNALRTLPPLV
jgi:hypothetical protein